MTTTPVGTPTTSELAVRLRAAVTRLHRRLRSGSLGGISPAQASALAMIERLESPQLSELAAAEQVRPPSMTRLVDALEELGLARRRVDDEDRRCQRVTLTAAGRKELAAIRVRKTAYLESKLSTLEDGDREVVARAVGILERLAEDR
jgi:DNA-binding MarR family transcriptional regulator